MHTSHEYCFQLLGPVRAWRRGSQVELGPPKQRALMALLLLNIGNTVRVAKVVETLWGDQQPRDAVNTVQVYVSRLRRAFRATAINATDAPGETLAKVASGYQLTVDPMCVDLIQFRSLLEQAQTARRQGLPSDAIKLLEGALELWQDDPLADIDDAVRERMKVDSLVRYRRQAVIELADAASDLGQPELAVSALEIQADQDPTDEPVHARLILAYGAVGRRAAALTVFESIRTALAETLGVDPSEELKQAHTTVLRL